MDISLIAFIQRVLNHTRACSILSTDYPGCQMFWAGVYLTAFITVFLIFMFAIRHLYNEQAIKKELERRKAARAAIADQEIMDAVKWNPLNFLDTDLEPELAERIRKIIAKT